MDRIPKALKINFGKFYTKLDFSMHTAICEVRIMLSEKVSCECRLCKFIHSTSQDKSPFFSASSRLSLTEP